MKLQKTITTIFIVPTLSIGKEKLEENGFINGYVKDNEREVQYDNCIYLVFKPENLDKFKNFLDDEYERTKSILDDYDYPNGIVVVVYKLNSRLDDDIALVKQGKYSKTSKRFQEIFPKVVKVKKNGLFRDEISLQYRIFNKTEDLLEFWENKLDVKLDEDAEVWSTFIEDNESFTLEKIKENV